MLLDIYAQNIAMSDPIRDQESSPYDDIVRDGYQGSDPVPVRIAKTPSFSKSNRLTTLHAKLVHTTAVDREWTFSVHEISHHLPRGIICKALFDLGGYMNDSILAHKDSGKHENIEDILSSLGQYILCLYLEAEWLCVSKGFSSNCISFLRLLPKELLKKVILQCLHSDITDEKENLNRRISDLQSLAMTEEFLDVMGKDGLSVATKLVAAVGLENHAAIDSTRDISTCNAISYHKSCVSVLKALNLLLLNLGRLKPAHIKDSLSQEESKIAFKSIARVLNDVTSDRDVLCQCGVSFVGLLYVSQYVHNQGDLERALREFLSSQEQLKKKFEGNEDELNPINQDYLGNYDLENPDHLVKLLLGLPALGCVSVIRGILNFMYAVHGKEDGITHDVGASRCSRSCESSFVVTVLYLSHRLFKILSETTLRMDLNFATLQGMQLFMSFINKETFKCAVLYQCMLELPDLILSFWTSKIRRIYNLGISTWNKLLEITFQLASDFPDAVIANYNEKLIHSVTNAFGTNLKLRYLALQRVLRYIGPEEILQFQPFLIPHMLCSLGVPPIKGCASALLTEMLTGIYSSIKAECKRLDLDDNKALLVFHCLIYPNVIAILHSRQLELPGPVDDKLIPPREASLEELDARVSALTSSFKNIFGKIQRGYVFEMLKLSTEFTRCDFYAFLPPSEQDALTSTDAYVVKDMRNMKEYIGELISHVRQGSTVATERIMYLEKPFNLAESMCFCNARETNTVEFVDAEVNGRHINGTLIKESSATFKFDLSALHCYPDLRLFYIPIQKLRNGIADIRSDISLNVLKAIAITAKTKQPVSPIEMELILYALHYCIKTSLPSFRQHFVASMKPFVRRLHNIITDNPALLERCLSEINDTSSMAVHMEEDINSSTKEQNNDKARHVKRHCHYMRLYLKALATTINPCTSDFKNTTALELLFMTFSVFSEGCIWDNNLVENLSSELVATLYMALFYMSTRQQDLIFKILQLIPPRVLCCTMQQYGGNEFLGYICRRGASSLWSVKTVPYIGGAKALTLLLRAMPPTNQARQALLSGDMESAITASCSETYEPEEHASVVTVLDYLLDQLGAFCERLDDNIDVDRTYMASSPAGLLSLYSHYLDSVPVSLQSKIISRPQFEAYLEAFYDKVKSICDKILKYVGREYDLDKKENKDYQIDCRGHLITKEQTYEFTCTSSREKEHMSCVLCDGSFECYKTNLSTTPRCSVPDDSNLRPFTVLCWKAVYESCDAMRAMLQWVLPHGSSGSISIASVRAAEKDNAGTSVSLIYGRVRRIGHYIISSLMSCRHFGCTDALSDLLTWICKKLVMLGLHSLLREWVDVLLELLKGYSVTDQQWNDLFVMLRDSHRRSEPIGRSFTSIIKAEGDRHKPVLLPLVVNTLLDLCRAERPFAENPRDGFTVVDIRIHSLNILCAIFKCKELRWSNDVHAGAALCASLKNMSHGDWSVRNSASLLFSSVLHHMIGNDLNSASNESLLDQKLDLWNNKELAYQLNRILISVHDMTVLKSETYDNLNPPKDYSALYQSSTFVFNFLSRISLYSFPGDAACRLVDNVGATLFSSNAAIRAMSAKILAKNYIETSRSGLCHIITERCKLVLSEINHSNRTNGLLLLIQECIDTMVSNGQHYMLIPKEKHGEPLVEQLASLLDLVNKDEISCVNRTLESWEPASILLATVYIVIVKTNCFENALLCVTILEKLCIVCARVDSFYDLIIRQSCKDVSSSFPMAECMMLLAKYCANLLGEEIYQVVIGAIPSLQQFMLPLVNNNIKRLVENFSRLREDDTVKARAASTLVKSIFVLTRAQDSCYTQHAVGKQASEFISFTCFLLDKLANRFCSQRALEAVLDQLSSLTLRGKLFLLDSCGANTLWVSCLSILPQVPQHFIAISAFKFLNALGIRCLSDSIREVNIFDSAWELLFRNAVSERLLYNTDFMLEAWKSSHLYVRIHFHSPGLDNKIVEIAAGLLMRIVDPGADVAVRKVGAQFLQEVIQPLNGSKYPSDQRGMYILHVVVALILLLQDENDNIRQMAVSCCASMIHSTEDDNLTHLDPQRCMERMLQFSLLTLPVEWVTKVFQQMTMLDKELYDQINYRLHRLQQSILENKISLTAVDVDRDLQESQTTSSHIILAEMDTVFNVEPQNMYTETIIYVVYVDKLLCKVLHSSLDPSAGPGPTPDEVKALATFVRTYPSHIVKVLSDHMSQNSEAKPEHLEGHVLWAVACDPFAILCCVAGFSRCCLSLIWPADVGQIDQGCIWEHLDTFYRLLLRAGRMWFRSSADAYRAVHAMKNSGSVASKIEAIGALEQFLNTF